MNFVIIFFGWIFSLCLHEFAHAFVAYQGGDYTVKEKGYLSFNPLRYMDPFTSIILPLIFLLDRKSTRLNSSHIQKSRMPSSA